MEIKINQLTGFFQGLSDEDMFFLGKIPYSINLERELRNYKSFLAGGLPNRSRVNMGKPYLFENNIVGYISFAIIQNANPTKYEREFIGLDEKLNYLYLKKLAIDSNFRKNVGSELIKSSLSLSRQLNKNCICDVRSKNTNIIKLLSKKGFEEYFSWEAKDNSNVIRMIHK
jgi:ribosomal protein S18 acetylase RimI-like enzyme